MPSKKYQDTTHVHSESQTWVNSIPPLPYTIREKGKRLCSQPNPSKVWLQHISGLCHKQGQVPSRWPSCDSRHHLVWDFRCAGSACARERTSHAYFAWLLRSCFFLQERTAQIGTTMHNRKTPKHQPWKQLRTMQHAAQSAPADTYKDLDARVSPKRGRSSKWSHSLFPSAQVCTSWWLTKAVSASESGRNEGHGLKFLATRQWASGTDQVSEVPAEAMHLTLRQVR